MPHPITIPADLAEVIATHRALFGGFTMMADDDKGESDDQKNEAEKADTFKSEESKKAVLADLHSERTKRQELEQRVNELAPLKDQLARLQAAFGPQKNDDGKGETPDAIAEITRRLDEADHKAEVERLARIHRITEDDDVALLAAIKDPQAREALAKRIAPAEGDQDKGGARRPKPDPSVGRSGGEGNRSTSVESGRSLYADTHKIKTTP